MEEMGKIYRDDDNLLWIVRNESQDEYCVQDMVAADPEHERDILRVIKGEVLPNATFIDIGAHLGYFSLRLASLFSRIAAFEPSSFNREGLLTNIRLNNISNIDVFPIALGEEEGVDVILERGGGSRLKDMCPTYIDQTGSSVATKVHVTTIDRAVVVPTEGPILFKIDTEGMELPILRGGINVLRSRKCYLMIEHHKLSSPELNNIDEVISKFLIDLGYTESWRNDEQQKIAFKNY